MRIRFVFFVCLMWGGGAASAAAATLTVCSSGCAYTALQPAIDAAAPGDTILLRAGQTFVGNVVLRAKPASSSWITIRSDAPDSSLPADGVRLVPSGKPGANTSRSLLPRLLGQGGALKTTPVIRTAAGAHHYVLKFLEVDGAANLGFETLITIGDDTTATPAQDIVLDRIYAHGDPYKGMKRGVTLNGIRTDVLNSYISDIKAVNADSQAIAGYNGAGPFRIINNYLEAAGENILFGGSDPAVQGLVPTGIEIRRNHFFKQLSWQNPILPAPPTPGIAVSSASGSLTAGRHYFKVVALLTTDSRTVVSVPSPEVSALMPGGKAVTLSWTAIPGAERYRLYRGTTAGGESRYLETSGAVTSFTYTGASEASGTPAVTGTKWTVKNIFELKNARQVVVDGNILENIWQAGQFGYAFVLTPRNQSGTAPWVHVRDITITNNIVRHAGGVLHVTGYDATNTSQQTQRITIRNNLFYDIDSVKWGGSTAKVLLVGEGAADVVIDRNTIIAANSTVVYAYGSPMMTGFVYTNNIARHNTYGLNGANGRSGSYSLDMYFSGAIVRNNVLAGGTASLYPTPNAFPTVAQWDASFANAAAADYRLLTSSVFYAAGAGGSVPGANIGTLNAALAGNVVVPDPVVDPPPPPPPAPGNTAPVARPGGPYSGTKGTALVVDGSGSSDADGTVAGFSWQWGDEVVVNAGDTSATTIVGSAWTRASTSGAAGGVALHNPDKAAAKATTAAAAPASYVDVRFYAAAGVPYRLWFRMKAQGDSYTNDSMFVQFSGAVTSTGAAANRIGTSSAAIVILEEGSGGGVSGWGWNDDGYGTLGAPVYFATSGLQTLRVQQREDGIMWDQLVLSAGTFFSARPGLTRADATVIAPQEGQGMVTSHIYPSAGTYPIRLTVTDDKGATGAAFTTVVIR